MENVNKSELEMKQVKDIELEFQKQINNLSESIERVGIRQDELRGYIVSVSQNIDELKQQISSLTPSAHEVRAKFHLAIQKNNELISRLYDTIANFESVRHRYQQDIGRMTKDKLYFINIELKRLENKFENNSNDALKFMKELRNLVATVTKNESVQSHINDALNKPEYSME